MPRLSLSQRPRGRGERQEAVIRQLLLSLAWRQLLKSLAVSYSIPSCYRSGTLRLSPEASVRGTVGIWDHGQKWPLWSRALSHDPHIPNPSPGTPVTGLAHLSQARPWSVRWAAARLGPRLEWKRRVAWETMQQVTETRAGRKTPRR